MTKRFAFAAVLSVTVVTLGCSPPQPASTPDASQQSKLWGDLAPVVSVKELMRDMLDPASDFIFNSVSTEITAQGVIEHLPKTDQDWEKIRFGAVTLVEGGDLLKVRRPFAPAGDVNNTTGPDVVELTPDQITAKVQHDPVEWNARIQALRNVGLEVLEIVKRKDVNELWDASENLDNACEACHRSYWYPGEDAEWYRRRNQHLDEMVAKGLTQKP